ncbi:6429_t:CDS:2 [Ambispora gerdemannii]|uniref:6429_t:CDS:1 n=1 Tax=Ambispora gerdemannii TaxID=144530 RepID=A0A9N9B1M7_9GLOM|nr:6429_t:CDS:2 [Ambispora gerdemannii]
MAINSAEEWLEKAINTNHITLFDHQNLKLCESLGEGSSGQVRRAEWNHNLALTLNVAVKSLKGLQNSTADKDYREMVKELQLLQDTTMSPNVVQFYGVTKEPDGMNSMSVVRGHPPYIEPLCFKGNYWPDARSDIYSLGVVLWELSSGRPPMTHISPSAIGYNVVMGMRESPITGTPDGYVQLYTECWDGKPENRPNIDSVYKRLKFIGWPEEQDVYDEGWIFASLLAKSSAKYGVQNGIPIL